MIIADRMKKNPVTATPDMSISEASAKMKAERSTGSPSSMTRRTLSE